MWDNFATLTAGLAKVRVWFNSKLTFNLEFSAIFLQITLSKLISQGRHGGGDFLQPRGDTLARPLTLRH